jgi:hypothetical protein
MDGMDHDRDLTDKRKGREYQDTFSVIHINGMQKKH